MRSRVVGVHGNLVLCGVTDETFIIEEGDIRRCRAITLVIGNDLNTIVLPNTDAAGEMIRSSEGTLISTLTSRSCPDRYQQLLSYLIRGRFLIVVTGGERELVLSSKTTRHLRVREIQIVRKRASVRGEWFYIV